MNVLDGCLVLFWIALQLTWVIASVLRKLPQLRGEKTIHWCCTITVLHAVQYTAIQAVQCSELNNKGASIS